MTRLNLDLSGVTAIDERPLTVQERLAKLEKKLSTYDRFFRELQELILSVLNAQAVTK